MDALFLIGEYDEKVYNEYKDVYDVYMCLFEAVESLKAPHTVLSTPFHDDIIANIPNTTIQNKIINSWPYREGYMQCLALTYRQYDTIIVLPFQEVLITKNLTTCGVYWPSWIYPMENLTYESVARVLLTPSITTHLQLSNHFQIFPLADRPLILISSIIETIMRCRSKWSTETRYLHTVRQLQSIRKYFPESYIVVMEASKFSVCNYVSELAQYADTVIWFADDEVLMNFAHVDPNKNKTEVYMISRVLEKIKNVYPSHIGKFNGRYWLNNPHNLFAKEIVMNASYAHCYSQMTIEPQFYSIPIRYLEEFKASQAQMLKLLETQFIGVEQMLWNEFACNKVLEPYHPLGLKGYQATGMFRYI